MTAWRGFRIRRDGAGRLYLGSIADDNAGAWQREMTAACRLSGGACTRGVGCPCGLHAFAERSQLRHYGARRGTLEGELILSGAVKEASSARMTMYRAEHAEIIRLFYADERDHDDAETIATDLGVPLERLTSSATHRVSHRTCPICGNPVVIASTGRPRVYCTGCGRQVDRRHDSGTARTSERRETSTGATSPRAARAAPLRRVRRHPRRQTPCYLREQALQRQTIRAPAR